MNLIECISLAFHSLKANKLRAFLTMLGIIIGISSVIIITTLGKSVSKTLEYSFNSMGFNQVYMYADEIIEEDDDHTIYTSLDFFTDEVVNEFLEDTGDRFRYIRSTSAGTGTIENFRNETISAEIKGISGDNLSADNYKLIMGREISNRDVIEEKHSAVVSDIFVKQYFKENEYPIGKTIDFVIDNAEVQSFTIVGVVKAKTAEKRLDPGKKFIDIQSTVYIPYKTAANMKSSSMSMAYYAIFSINPSYNHSESVKLMEDYFNSKLKNTSPNASLDLYDVMDDFKIFNVILTVITIVFTLIAMISLIVGGIGVMNIMLVSIIERTREIGVRKALGAKNSAIRLQFVVEAIMLCVIGGILGILIGVGEGVLLKLATDFIINNYKPEIKDTITLTIQPSIIAIVGSVLFCMFIGVFFGFYPANKAAKMDPIDALRYD